MVPQPQPYFDLFMGKRPGWPINMKVRDVIKIVHEDGWQLLRTRGSHRQYKHPTKSGRVTISGHLGDDIHPGTLKSVLAQAGLRAKP